MKRNLSPRCFQWADLPKINYESEFNQSPEGHSRRRYVQENVNIAIPNMMTNYRLNRRTGTTLRNAGQSKISVPKVHKRKLAQSKIEIETPYARQEMTPAPSAPKSLTRDL